MWMILCFCTFFAIAKIHAPPVRNCLVQHHAYKGVRSPCDDGEKKMLAELDNDDFSDVEKFGTTGMADLLCSRALGIFDHRKHNLNNLLICPKHLNELGKSWKRNEKLTNDHKCSIPQVAGFEGGHEANRHRADRSINKGDALKFWRNFQIFIPPGTGVCKRDQALIRALPHEFGTHEVATGTDNVEASYDLRHRRPHLQQQPQCTPDQRLTFSGKPRKRACSTGSSFEFSATPDSQDPLVPSTSKNCDQVKKGVTSIALAVGIPEGSLHFARSFAELEPATKRKRANTAVHVTDAVISAFAPDAPNELKEMVLEKTKGDGWHKKHPEQFLGMVQQMVDEYMKTETRRSRMHLLSFIAPWFRWLELEKFIPGLTPYAWREARRHAKMSKSGLIQPPQKMRLQRYDPKAVLEFLEFIASPSVASDMPFGFATAKLSTGVKQEIPNLLRTSVNTRIIQQYRMYMHQRGFTDEQLMSDSTMRRILHACKATTRKSMKGTEGISNLLTLVESIRESNGDSDWAKAISRVLKETKVFFKSDYKVQIEDDHEFSDYSTLYALSDPKDASFKANDDTTGVQHQRCSQCIELMDAFSSIETKITELTWPALEKTEAEFTFEQSRNGILNWQKHILRTIRQDKAREDIIRDLNENSVHLLLDWAMKFIPEKGREAQTDWYGKRGISWHITVALIKQQGRYYLRTFVHVFDHSNQDGDTVVAILVNTLKRIKDEIYGITTAYLRSDNAVCYHGAAALTAVAKISAASGVNIKRWDFSETQSGKGAADRASNIIKRHVKLFVAEGNAATTAAEFVRSASSYGGVKTTTFVHTGLKPINKGNRQKPSIPGISKFNNYEYGDGGEMRVWRAYKIGDGKIISYKATADLPELSPVSVMTKGQDHASFSTTCFWFLGSEHCPWDPLQNDPQNQGQPARTTANDEWTDSFIPEECGESEETDCNEGDTECRDDDDPRTLEGQDRQRLFPCDQDGCVKVYQSYKNWFKHMTVGKHVMRLERENIRDFSIRNYVKQIERNQLFQRAPSITAALRSQEAEENSERSNFPLPMGWALKDRKDIKRFTVDQKNFMTDKFDEGIRDSKKYDPRDVAKMMRKDPRFPSKSDWLTAAQIQSFWSRLSLNRERSLAETVPHITQQDSEDDDTDPAADDCIGDDAANEQLFREDVNEVIESNREQLFDSGMSEADFESHIEQRIMTRSQTRASGIRSRKP